MTDSEFVKRARKRLGYTQPDLAAALGVTTTTVYRWEAELRKLPAPTRKLIETLTRK